MSSTEITFDKALREAADALDAAKADHDMDRVRELTGVANTWVRIAELIDHHDRNTKPGTD